MSLKRVYNLSALVILLALTGCATIIGGDYSTAKTSGDGMGPATIADENTSLQNDKFSALTISNDFTGTNIVIEHEFKVESAAILTRVTAKGTTHIGGNLICNHSRFDGAVVVDHAIICSDSKFESGLRFGGSQLDLGSSSKVYGNIINTRVGSSSVIVINHSYVKGNIEFAESNGLVILKNGGEFKGTVVNGNLRQE